MYSAECSIISEKGICNHLHKSVNVIVDVTIPLKTFLRKIVYYYLEAYSHYLDFNSFSSFPISASILLNPHLYTI